MEDIKNIQTELLELSIKAGRRCAYDLRHAADDVQSASLRDMYHERADMWLNIFDPADGVKDYRNRLHQQITMLELEMNRYKRRLQEHNIDYSDIEMFPGL